jgi:carbamoyl-phosphate synthase / aspartate carbamoyltransferase
LVVQVACFGRTRQEAFLKAVLASGMKLPKKNVLVAAGNDSDRVMLTAALPLDSYV